MFAYVGAFTTPERKWHGDGINVYGLNAASAGGRMCSSHGQSVVSRRGRGSTGCSASG